LSELFAQSGQTFELGFEFLGVCVLVHFSSERKKLLNDFLRRRSKVQELAGLISVERGKKTVDFGAGVVTIGRERRDSENILRS